MKKSIFRLLLVFLCPAAAHSVHAQNGSYCIENRFSESSYFELSDLSVTRSVVYSVVRRWPGAG
ncbi:MAG: hypothetical protein KJS92_03585, partial [Bacteroidetes bacterium]|nr:hypothetical protein [Bacteroidota bacterium]